MFNYYETKYTELCLRNRIASIHINLLNIIIKDGPNTN